MRTTMRLFQFISGFYLVALATAICLWMYGPLYADGLPVLFAVGLSIQGAIGGFLVAAAWRL